MLVLTSRCLYVTMLIRTKLNSICKDIELLKSNFERLNRSTDLPANSSQVEALENENMALKIQLKDVEAERDSLKLALTCLAKDLNGLIYNQESTEKNQKPQEASEKTSANDGPWEQVEKRKQRNANKIKAKNKNSPSLEKNKSGPSSNEETIIVGDSIIKGLRRDLLSRAAKRPVTVRRFPGATTADMKHYLQPSLEAKPKAIVLHVRTNDLKNSSSGRNVAEKIVDLGNVIAANSPDTKLTISAITQRFDEDSLKKKITDCNKVLRTFCNQHGWSFVEHPNIDETCLNNHKLHLNKKGIAILASNFVNNIVR